MFWKKFKPTLVEYIDPPPSLKVPSFEEPDVCAAAVVRSIRPARQVTADMFKILLATELGAKMLRLSVLLEMVEASSNTAELSHSIAAWLEENCRGLYVNGMVNRESIRSVFRFEVEEDMVRFVARFVGTTR